MTKPNEPEALDLRPWGYARGSYIFKCIDCPEKPPTDWPIGDKRSIRCEKHAREAMERATSNPVADAGGVTQADKMVARQCNAWAMSTSLSAHEAERFSAEAISAHRLQSVAAAAAAKDAEIARLREALEFYGDKDGWNQPPVKTVAHELLGPAYENKASKVQRDRGTIARSALSEAREAGALADDSAPS